MTFCIITENENPMDYCKIEELYLNHEIKFLDRYDLKMKSYLKQKKEIDNE